MCENMELLNKDEIKSIVKSHGFSKVLNFSIENYADSLIGYLGEHLRLIVEVESDGIKSKLNFFVKCMPRFDKWKANYLKELTFFQKEYIMLSKLFRKFEFNREFNQWRPKLLFIREDLFVFEDVAGIGYTMPCHLNTMSYDEVMATVETLAIFHAQSFIYEEKKTKELNRPYRIWEDYSDHLQEPASGQKWRDVGRNAVIDFLKVYSTHKSKPNFTKSIDNIVPSIFEGGRALMDPSSVYRNVVIHRDLWSNNIFFKKQENGKMHAMIVDFQTVLYSSPMLDLPSVLYFNTTRAFRKEYIKKVIDFYYEALQQQLQYEDIDITTIIDKQSMIDSYEESVMFGITQAAIIVPIIAMNSAKREELFSNPKTCRKINEESRSQEFIELARENNIYHDRVIELFDEIVERYIYPKNDS